MQRPRADAATVLRRIAGDGAAIADFGFGKASGMMMGEAGFEAVDVNIGAGNVAGADTGMHGGLHADTGRIGRGRLARRFARGGVSRSGRPAEFAT